MTTILQALRDEACTCSAKTLAGTRAGIPVVIIEVVHCHKHAAVDALLTYILDVAVPALRRIRSDAWWCSECEEWIAWPEDAHSGDTVECPECGEEMNPHASLAEHADISADAIAKLDELGAGGTE